MVSERKLAIAALVVSVFTLMVVVVGPQMADWISGLGVTELSLTELATTPSKYNGQKITVTGVLVPIYGPQVTSNTYQASTLYVLGVPGTPTNPITWGSTFYIVGGIVYTNKVPIAAYGFCRVRIRGTFVSTTNYYLNVSDGQILIGGTIEVTSISYVGSVI